VPEFGGIFLEDLVERGRRVDTSMPKVSPQSKAREGQRMPDASLRRGDQNKAAENRGASGRMACGAAATRGIQATLVLSE